MPRSKLSAQIEKMSPQDSFHASKKGTDKILGHLLLSKLLFIMENKCVQCLLKIFLSNLGRSTLLIKLFLRLISSLSFAAKWCGGDFRPPVRPHGKSRAVHLRHDGNSPSGDQVGLQIEEGKLPRQSVSPSHHAFQGMSFSFFSGVRSEITDNFSCGQISGINFSALPLISLACTRSYDHNLLVWIKRGKCGFLKGQTSFYKRREL